MTAITEIPGLQWLVGPNSKDTWPGSTRSGSPSPTAATISGSDATFSARISIDPSVSSMNVTPSAALLCTRERTCSDTASVPRLIAPYVNAANRPKITKATRTR